MSNGEYFSNIVPMTNTADLFVRTGFAPDVVRLTNLYDGKKFLWNRCEHGHYQGAAASGGLATVVTGGVALTTTAAGIALCKFTENADDLTHDGSDPATVDGTNFTDGNGIKCCQTMDLLADDQLLLVEAWRMNFIWLKLYHDGGTTQLFAQDSSYDFRELGVSGNGRWLLYNQSNGNYAYVKKITQPAGKTRHCRLTLALNTDGDATTAAAMADNDVCYVFPIDAAPYPMSDVGKMT